MVALKVAPDEARKVLGWVEHEQFRSALIKVWLAEKVEGAQVRSLDGAKRNPG